MISRHKLYTLTPLLMRLFTCLFLLLLSISFTACFPELVDEEIVVVDTPDGSDTPDTDPDGGGVDVGNFNFSLGSYQLDHVYITTLPFGYEDKDVHQIIITRDDVAIDEQTLIGLSPALTLSIVSPKGSLAGTYVIGSADYGAEYSASRASIYRWLRFEQDISDPSGMINDGELMITEQDGEYTLTFNWLSQGTPRTGEVTTTLREITFPQSDLPTVADFQGNSAFTRGDATINLRHAYLVPEGLTYDGKRKHTLYLTEHEILEAGELTGTSTALMLKSYDNFSSFNGVYDGTSLSSTYLESLRPSLRRTLFCTNYNFVNGSFDTDEETEGETLVLRSGNEIMVRYTGTIRGTNVPAEGLYRGPVTVLD